MVGIMPLALLVALGATTPVLADAKIPADTGISAPTDASKALSDKDAPGRKICRPMETTGSLMLRSVCHTKSEWTEINAENARQVALFGLAVQNNPGGTRPR